MSTSKSSNKTNTIPSAEALEPVFKINRVYLKELSLEQPNSPEIFLDTEQPQVDIKLKLEKVIVSKGIFEICVGVNLHTKINDKTVFLVEATQAGIFEIRNMPADHLTRILDVICPQIIYPYLRSNVADIITRTGFSPIHLSEINFQAIADQKQAEEEAEKLQKPRKDSKK